MHDEDKKKKIETAIVLRKFYRDIQQNRILSEAKKLQFRTKDISRRERKQNAIRKTKIKKIIRGY